MAGVCGRCGRRRNKARSRKIERALKRHFEKMSSPGPRDVVDGDTSSDSDDVSDDNSDDDKTDQDSLDDDDDDAEVSAVLCKMVKGKGFPYSTLSVGPGADPGVQAVSLQVTVKSSTRR